MKVLCVCKFNQARSIAMASAIKHFYPQVETQSAGTHCVSGEPVPILTLETLTDWGIEPIARVSTPLHKSIRNQEFDLILCADDSVRRDVTTSLGSSQRVMDITELTTRSELIPVDPARSGFEHFQDQLGKVIFLAIRAIRRLLIPEGQRNYSLLQSGSVDSSRLKSAVLWAIDNSLIVIDTNWTRPNHEGWEKLSEELGIPINSYNPFSLAKDRRLHFGSININRIESDFYEREILSQTWMNLISQSQNLLISGFQPKGVWQKSHLALGLIHSDQPYMPNPIL